MSRDTVYEELKIGIQDFQKNIKKFEPSACEVISFELLTNHLKNKCIKLGTSRTISKSGEMGL